MPGALKQEDLWEDEGTVLTEDDVNGEGDNQGENVNVEVDGPDEDEIEVIIEPNKDKPRKPLGAKPDVDEDDDFSQYSAKVKKRLQKLTFEAREQARQRDEYKRQADELEKVAKSATREVFQLRKALNSGQSLLKNEAQSRIKTAMAAAEAKLLKAKELGDVAAEIEANKEIARLSVEADKVESFKPTPAPEKEEEVRVSRPETQLSPGQREFLRKHGAWFGKDDTMTKYAHHLHDRFVTFDGIQNGSDKYWEQLDIEMKKKFPQLRVEEDEGEDEEEEVPVRQHTRRKPATVVSPVRRSTKGSRTVVRLTETQQAIAKRLGLTVQQYAEQIAKEMKQ